MQARVSRKLRDRLEALPQDIRDIAWKAFDCAAVGGVWPLPVVVTTAIAREMVGFIWAIARRVQPQTIG